MVSLSDRSLCSFRALVAAIRLRGYRGAREMSAEALALIPMFLLIRGMAIIGWMHQRPELDRSRFLHGLKDFVRAQCENLRAAVLK